MEIDKNDQFFIENEEKVNALFDDRNRFLAKLSHAVEQLLEMIEIPNKCDRQWIYAKYCLVHDFKLSGYSIAFDLYIRPKGWDLQISGKNKEAQIYLSGLMSTAPLNDQKCKMRNFRYMLEKFDLRTDLKTIKEKLLGWIGLLLQSDNNKNISK